MSESDTYRDPQGYNDKEKEDWDRLGNKLDDWIASEPESTPFSREEMVRFFELWFTHNQCPDYVDYCLNKINKYRDNDCLWK